MQYIKELQEFLESELSDIGLDEDSFEIHYEDDRGEEEFYRVDVTLSESDKDIEEKSLYMRASQDDTESYVQFAVKMYADAGHYTPITDYSFNIKWFWIALLA